ncbi:hypothetical protein BRD20_01650 [Halobacteriales archaeon SW_8_65_20]|nr:MAG: hypothetical protein BRD20_01650 [Halobacteriales archaeon SW_8_65_20]
MYLVKLIAEPVLTEFKCLSGSESCIVENGNKCVVSELSAEHLILFMCRVTKVFGLLFTEVLLFTHI